jgi:hypothetical protein
MQVTENLFITYYIKVLHNYVTSYVKSPGVIDHLVLFGTSQFLRLHSQNAPFAQAIFTQPTTSHNSLSLFLR